MKRTMRSFCVATLLIGLFMAMPIGGMKVHALSLRAPVAVGDAKSDVCSGIGLTSTAAGGCGDQGAQVNSAVTGITNLIATAVGLAAVIMIIFSGFKFITANGDANSVSGAKRTMVYSIIGLFIAASAVTLVHFFLSKAT